MKKMTVTVFIEWALHYVEQLKFKSLQSGAFSQAVFDYLDEISERSPEGFVKEVVMICKAVQKIKDIPVPNPTLNLPD